MKHCFYDDNSVYQDGYCERHWREFFTGMTNHERMIARKQLREARYRASAAGQQKIRQKMLDNANSRATMNSKKAQA